MKVQFNDQMSCQITQQNRDINAQQGKYVDLKESPERVMELPEARDWPQFGKFIADLNRVPGYRTTGCTSKGKTEGGHEAPFVDITFDDEELRFCRRALSDLKVQFLLLAEQDNAPELTISTVLKSPSL